MERGGALHIQLGLRVGAEVVGSDVWDHGGWRGVRRRVPKAGVPGPRFQARLQAVLEHSVNRGVLRRPLAGVELIDHTLRDALQHLLGEDA